MPTQEVLVSEGPVAQDRLDNYLARFEYLGPDFVPAWSDPQNVNKLCDRCKSVKWDEWHDSLAFEQIYRTGSRVKIRFRERHRDGAYDSSSSDDDSIVSDDRMPSPDIASDQVPEVVRRYGDRIVTAESNGNEDIIRIPDEDSQVEDIERLDTRSERAMPTVNPRLTRLQWTRWDGTGMSPEFLELMGVQSFPDPVEEGDIILRTWFSRSTEDLIENSRYITTKDGPDRPPSSESDVDRGPRGEVPRRVRAILSESDENEPVENHDRTIQRFLDEERRYPSRQRRTSSLDSSDVDDQPSLPDTAEKQPLPVRSISNADTREEFERNLPVLDEHEHQSDSTIEIPARIDSRQPNADYRSTLDSFPLAMQETDVIPDEKELYCSRSHQAGLVSIIRNRNNGPTVSDVREAAHEGCHLCTMILSTWLSSRANKRLATGKILFTPSIGDWRFDNRRISLEARHHYMFGKATSHESASLKMRFGFKMIAPSNIHGDVRARGLTQEIPVMAAAEDIASYWLQNCMANHTSSCGTGSDPILPTRVINVRGGAESMEPRLVLSNGRRARYATLSYTWGKPNVAGATTDASPKYGRAIDLKSLPKTFQDAMKMTLALGLEYLWIDALCILQDSVEDVQKELGSMADIYKNATITLASIGATSADGGFSIGRNKLAMVDCQLSTFLALDAQVEGQTAQLTSGTIHDRAWCFQEVQLAPRLLSCGGRELYFQCRQGAFREGRPTRILLDDNGDKFTRIFDEAIMDEEEAYSTWRKVVEKYSRLKLTYESDKLLAISGLAARFSSLFEHEGQTPKATDYLAGIWRKDVRASLMWESDKEAKAVIPYRAPSWSWASSEASITFHRQSCRSREDEAYRKKDDALFEVLEASTVLVSDRVPYGAVQSGKLVLYGPVTPIPEGAYTLDLRRNMSEDLQDDENYQVVAYTAGPGVQEMPAELGIEMIEWDQKVSKDPDCVCMLLEPKWGLVLAPIRQPGAVDLYQRVGFVNDRGFGFPSGPGPDGRLERPGGIGYYDGHPDWQKRVVTII